MDITRRRFCKLTAGTISNIILTSTVNAAINDRTKNLFNQLVFENFKQYKSMNWIQNSIDHTANYGTHFLNAGNQHYFSEFYLAGICLKETMGNPYLYSHKGAIGLMQIMPKTARAMGFTPKEITCRKNQGTNDQRISIQKNINCAATYLSYVRTKIVNSYPLKDRVELSHLIIGSYFTGTGGIQGLIQQYHQFYDIPSTSPTYQYVVRVNALTKLVEENRNSFGFK